VSNQSEPRFQAFAFQVQLAALHIGDTTEPIPAPIIAGMQASVEGLGSLEGYGQGVGTRAFCRPEFDSRSARTFPTITFL
jgi:hypothetical protein